MTIRSQNLLIIVPLFAALCGLIGAFVSFIQVRELYWGYHEEARSLAISVAAFLDEDRFLDLRQRHDAGEPPPLTLQRTLDWDRAQRVVGKNPSGDRILFEFPTGSDTGFPAVPVPGDTVERRHSVSEIVASEGRTPSLVAYAAAFDSDDEPIGVIGVETDVSGYVEDRRAMIVQAVTYCVAGIAFGTVISLLLSTALGRNIASITRMAETLGLSSSSSHAGGAIPTSQSEPESRVREVEELSNTFDVMLSVLNEDMSRIKRGLVEGEQYRQEISLAHSYESIFRPPFSGIVAGLELRGQMTGTYSPGHFHCCFEHDGHGHLFLGHVPRSEHPGIDPVIHASALVGYFRRSMLGGEGFEDTVRKTVEHFRPATLTAARWENGGSEATVFRLAGETPAPRRETLSLAAEAPVPFSNLAPEALERVRTYLSTYPSRSLEEIMEEVVLLIESGDGGGVLFLGRKTSTRSERC